MARVQDDPPAQGVSRLTAREQILAFMEGRIDIVSTQRIASEVQAALPSVYTALGKLVEEGMLRRVRMGFYANVHSAPAAPEPIAPPKPPTEGRQWLRTPAPAMAREDDQLRSAVKQAAPAQVAVVPEFTKLSTPGEAMIESVLKRMAEPPPARKSVPAEPVEAPVDDAVMRRIEAVMESAVLGPASADVAAAMESRAKAGMYQLAVDAIEQAAGTDEDEPGGEFSWVYRSDGSMVLTVGDTDIDLPPSCVQELAQFLARMT